jgi:uncharacterized protein (TIGR02444 family)
MPSTEPGDAWRHVLALYGRPGVAPACLLLQDRLDVDVLVLLHMGFVCQQHGLRLQAEQIEAADAVVRVWREQVVRPLRAARRAIARDDPQTQALRQRVQQAELGAEQHAFALLTAMPLWADAPATVDAAAPTASVAWFYAQRSGREAELQRPEIASAIALLNQAWADALS